MATGACICSFYLGKLIGVLVPFPVILVLGLTVWLIYTFDHLSDAIKIKGEANTERHRFHQLHYRFLVVTCALVLLIIGGLLFILPYKIILFGAALGCIVIAYFMLLHFLGLKASYHKEILVAVIYTLGIFLAPFCLYEGKIEIEYGIVFIQFFIIALINLITFSLLESEKDSQNGFPSLVNLIGRRSSLRLIQLLLLFQLVSLAILMVRFGNFELSLIVFLMTIILGGILLFPAQLGLKERYRLIGDFIFFIPIIGLI